jgi:NADH/NAD ratio-sensing transcriptional regulator Rex
MTLMNVGITDIATLINTKYDYVAVGEGGAPAASATTLASEVLRVQSTNTMADVGSVGFNNASVQTATFNITTGYAITNSAVFDISSAGVMLCGQNFAAINVINGDTLITVWKEVVS